MTNLNTNFQDQNKKGKEKQHLIGGSMAAFAGSALFLLFLLSTLGSRMGRDEIADKSNQRAEVLAFQVAQIYREALINFQIEHPRIEKNRMPASQNSESDSFSGVKDRGTIGTDPWGQTYNYKVFNLGTYGIKIAIWSKGPNHQSESDQILIAQNPEHIEFLKDDKGLVLQIQDGPK